MPQQYGSNALRTDGTSFNVGNVLADRPSIRLFGSKNLGQAMQGLLGGGMFDDSVENKESARARSTTDDSTPAPVKRPPLTGENEIWARERLMDGLLANRSKEVRQAVEDGLDVNFKDRYGNTPLHHAAKNGKHRIAVLLLELGADPTLVNRSGERPAEVASTGELIDLLYREPEKKPPRKKFVAEDTIVEQQRQSSAVDELALDELDPTPTEPWLEAFLRHPVAFICSYIHDLSGKMKA